jgi:putative hemolysin
MSSTGSRSLSAALQRAVETRDRHIIDALIQERAPTLLGTPLLGALNRAVLYPLLGYREAVRVADAMAARDGFGAMSFLSDELDLGLRVDGLERIPERGPALVVSNHPTGIADGVVVFDALAASRRDLMMFANRDAVRVAPSLADLVIPVEWVQDKRSRSRTRETLQATQQAFRDERLVVMFPSGRLAYVDPQDDTRTLRERPWMATAVSLARRHGVPLIPMHIDGRNSPLFYLFSRVSEQLRDITLFHEVLNKREGDYHVRIGEPIAPEALDGDAEALTDQLQRHVETRFEAPPPGA